MGQKEEKNFLQIQLYQRPSIKVIVSDGESSIIGNDVLVNRQNCFGISLYPRHLYAQPEQSVNFM
jgi:hypothetical protein